MKWFLRKGSELAVEPKTLSAVITLLLAAVVVTPLCGLFFGCGCTWPWSGFVALCNYYQPAAEHRCPWCASLLAGWLSVGLAIASGVSAALFAHFNAKRAIAGECLARIGLGMVVFTVIAVLGAWLALTGQGYPWGLLTQSPN
ncbi:MAG: hypothetical protein ACU83P_10910 [Gammaproteobacteria bacterium]